MAFGVVTSTFEVYLPLYSKLWFTTYSVIEQVLKEQKKYDDAVSTLADKVERIVPFVHKVETETLYDDNMLLEGIIKKMYNITLDTAEFICGYVRRSPLSAYLISYR